MPARMVCALLAFLAGAAHAQLAGEFMDREPAHAARDAFDTPLGRQLAEEFGRILRASAEPRCLRMTAIDPATLEARGREVLVRTGTQMLEIHASAVNQKKLQEAFAAIAGKDAWAERERLRREPDVRRYLESVESVRLARFADVVADTLDRHAAKKRFLLKRKLSPYQGRLQDSREFAQQGASDSPALRRWFELSYRVAESLQQAADYDRVLRMGPEDMTPQVAADLAGLCIPQR